MAALGGELKNEYETSDSSDHWRGSVDWIGVLCELAKGPSQPDGNGSRVFACSRAHRNATSGANGCGSARAATTAGECINRYEADCNTVCRPTRQRDDCRRHN